MKIHEIMESSGGTSSGGIATVAMPMGAVQTRNDGNFFSGLAANSSNPTPNTPKKYKKKLKVRNS
jgi:hypothetical protein